MGRPCPSQRVGVADGDIAALHGSSVVPPIQPHVNESVSRIVTRLDSRERASCPAKVLEAAPRAVSGTESKQRDRCESLQPDLLGGHTLLIDVDQGLKERSVAFPRLKISRSLDDEGPLLESYRPEPGFVPPLRATDCLRKADNLPKLPDVLPPIIRVLDQRPIARVHVAGLQCGVSPD